MKIVKQSFAFFLVFVMLVCACPVSISAASTNGEITVGNASGYPGDIVGVKITMNKAPSNGFVMGKFIVSFGKNLEYVNTVQGSLVVPGYGTIYNFGNLVPSNPYDAGLNDNGNIILYYDNGTAKDNYTDVNDLEMATVYFRIKGVAKSTDDSAFTTVTVSSGDDLINVKKESVEFDYNAGAVTIIDRYSALGETLVGHSLTLDGNISLNFHLDVSDTQLLTDDTALVNFTVVGKDADNSFSVPLSDFEVKDGALVVSCSLPAVLWNSDVKVMLSIRDKGTNIHVFGEEYTYSVKNYALYMLSGGYTTNDADKDAKLNELCVALLNYGAYSQLRFGHDEASLANRNVYERENLSSISSLVGSFLDESIVDNAAACNITGTDITYLGADVAVDSATAIRHYFSINGNVEDYKFYIIESEVSSTEVAPVVIDNEITITIANIAAAYLDKPYTIKAMKTDSTSSITITYSVKSYMASVIGSDAGNDVKNVVRAMYLYSEAANAYFGK